MAFEQEGFCVVRGPDMLWGGDIHRFHPPAGKFDGVIGGPPCQSHSRFAHLVRATGKEPGPDLIPEFVRCVAAAQPGWFVMENVPDAPWPELPAYKIQSFLLDNRWLGEKQARRRRWFFGNRGVGVDLRRFIQLAALEDPDWHRTVLASGGMRPGTETKRGRLPGKNYGYTSKLTVKLARELQGLPPDFLDHCPFTVHGKQHAIGNGVPLPMGRAIAKAVKAALEQGNVEVA